MQMRTSVLSIVNERDAAQAAIGSEMLARATRSRPLFFAAYRAWSAIRMICDRLATRSDIVRPILIVTRVETPFLEILSAAQSRRKLFAYIIARSTEMPTIKAANS
jgi:hypothetical protein